MIGFANHYTILGEICLLKFTKEIKIQKGPFLNQRQIET